VTLRTNTDESSADRFRENLEGLKAPTQDQFDEFTRLTKKLLQVSKADLNDQRGKPA